MDSNVVSKRNTRPLSIWLAQFCMFILLGGAVLALWANLAVDSSSIMQQITHSFYLIRVGTALAAIAALIGMSLRKSYGRWMALAFVCWHMLRLLYQMILTTDYSGNAEVSMSLLAAVFIMYAYLTVSLAFSAEVKNYFESV